MTDFFLHFKTNVSRDPQGQNVIVPKRAHFGYFLTEMEFLGNFLRNDTKFVEIPLVVAEISLFEFRQLVQFFDQTPISEGAYLQNYSPNFNKIKNLGFFT